MKSDREVHVLLLDVDRCLVTTRCDQVGKPFVQDFAEVIPASFIAKCAAALLVTHRCFDSVTRLAPEFYSGWMEEASAIQGNSSDFLTCRVVDNFKAAFPNIEFLGVSTPDDSCDAALKLPLQDQFGFGYKKLLEKHEQEFLRLNERKEAKEGYKHPSVDMPLKPFKFEGVVANKNSQLVQVENFLRVKKFKNTRLVLHFLDDMLEICQAVQQLKSDARMSCNTTLNVYQHMPHKNIIADINVPLVTAAGGLKEKLSLPSRFALLCSNLFACGRVIEVDENEAKQSADAKIARPA